MSDALQTVAELSVGTTPQSSRVNPKWVTRIMLMAVALLAFGVWGLVDAVHFYPARGSRAAEYFEYQYLDALKQAGDLRNDKAAITDPVPVYARLRTAKKDASTLSGADTSILQWFTQLSHIGKLDPRNTTYPRTDFRREKGQNVAVGSADERYAALREKFTRQGSKAPSALAGYDIPSQWLIMAGGLAGGLYMLWLIQRAKAKTFRWEPSTRTLTLPTGESISPRDVVEYDKSKWDKLYVSLHLRPEHAQLPGKRVELDLLRHIPVEAWVLEMEKASEMAGGQSNAPESTPPTG